MEKTSYHLFIDETGDPELESPKPYILSGCSIEYFRRDAIKSYADHIKYKYWGRTDIVFHSKEIGKAENEFKILTDPKIKHEFEADLLKFLKEAQYKLLFVVLDKPAAKLAGWTTSEAMLKTAQVMLRNFILALKSVKANGDVLIEPSYFEKDGMFLRAFNYYRSPKSEIHSEFNIDYKDIQETLTALSFVTKNNYDTEVQIADLMAYAASQAVKPRRNDSRDSYEKQIVKILQTKMFKLNYKNRATKSAVYKAIKPLAVIPETLGVEVEQLGDQT